MPVTKYTMKKNTVPTKQERCRPGNRKKMIRDKLKHSPHTKLSHLTSSKCWPLVCMYELGNKEAQCYMWHEGEGGHGSSEISTCMFQYLSTLSGTEHVLRYSDTCGGLNRNAGFSAMCLHAVKTLPISIIDHKFMEFGHCQMECDSVHAAIETARKNVPVHSPEGYYTLWGWQGGALAHWLSGFQVLLTTHGSKAKTQRDKQLVGRKPDGCARQKRIGKGFNSNMNCPTKHFECWKLESRRPEVLMELNQRRCTQVHQGSLLWKRKIYWHCAQMDYPSLLCGLLPVFASQSVRVDSYLISNQCCSCFI